MISILKFKIIIVIFFCEAKEFYGILFFHVFNINPTIVQKEIHF